VYRSLNHIYAQVIDDAKGETLASASTLAAKINRRQRCRGQGSRQAGGRAGDRQGRQEGCISTVAAISITDASRRWPMRRAKQGSTSKVSISSCKGLDLPARSKRDQEDPWPRRPEEQWHLQRNSTPTASS
jgi:hypothetical protein